MNTVRRSPRTVRTAGLAVAAAAALSLTACGGGDGQGAQGQGGSGDADVRSEAAQAGGGDPGMGEGGKGDPGMGEGGKGDPGMGQGVAKASAGGKTCDLGTTAVRLEQTGGTAPVVLLKATNGGSTRCDLYGYPFLGHPDAQAPIEVGGNKPHAVVSLRPGGSACAALTLEPGNAPGTHREKQLTVELADREQYGTGDPVTVTAPGDGLALSDENSRVSYWNTTPEQAMA